MLLRIEFPYPFLLVFLGAFSNMAQGASVSSVNGNEELTAQSKITWRTVSGPEVNFLLKNSGNQDMTFSFDLSAMSKNDFTCRTRLSTLDRSILDGLELRERREQKLAAGRLPAHGWAYRTYSMFGGMQQVPCKIGFRIVAYSAREDHELFNAVIEFPSKADTYGVTSYARHELSVRSMVERDFRDGQVLVNILIENNGANDEQIFVSDRSLNCAGQTRATWNTEWPVSEGEDNGPRNVGRGSWAVLVTPVRLAAGKSFDRCTATFWVSRRMQLADKSDFEWRLVRKIDVPLTPVGTS